MAENENFVKELQNALNKKSEWFNTVRLQEMLEQYRILETCTKNLYDQLVKKSIIIPDPYRRDKKISEISIPDTSSFTENEASSVLGSRFSEYGVMIDYVCTYCRFTLDTFQIPVVKKLLELNKVFKWEDLSSSSSDANTRALADAIAQVKTNAQSVIISMVQDATEKNAEAVLTIAQILNEIGTFQRELYKIELRRDLFDHPEFNKDKAFESPDSELAEIKRLYTKVMGKKPFYSDLIKEIIAEDIGPDKENVRAKLLKSLEIKQTVVNKTVKKQVIPEFHIMIMDTVLALTASAPTLSLLSTKVIYNADLVFKKSSGFFAKLGALLRKAFHLKEKEHVCTVSIPDAKTGAVRIEKIKLSELLDELGRKERVYTSISMKGPEFNKIDSASDDNILSFVNKQVSEMQSCFTKLNALDGFFKKSVDIMQASKVKGMQIELAALRNSIMNTNKKRGEYAAAIEENQLMRSLGVSDDE